MSTINVLKTVITASDDGFSKTFAEATTSARQFNQMLKDGEALYKATRTPLEAYEAEVSKLDNLLREGAISQETYNRSLAKMEQSPFGAAKSTNMLTSSLSKMVPVFDPISLALKVLSAGFDLAKDAAAAMADVLVDSVVSGVGRLDALDDAAAKLGVTTEALSTFRYAAGFAGVESNTMDNALGKMLVNLDKAAEDGGKVGEAFERLGLNAKELRAAGPEEAFVQIADALAKIEDPAVRARLAVDVFGKSGKELGGILAQGGDAFRAAAEEAGIFGQRIDSIDAAKVAEAADAAEKLSLMWEGVQNALAVELAPAITAVTQQLIDMGKEGGSIGDQVKIGVEGAMAALQTLLNGLDMAARNIKRSYGVGLFDDSPLMGDKLWKDFEKARADAESRARQAVANRKNAGTPLDMDSIGNDGASALGNTPFDREAERLREQLRTPLEVLQDELTKFGDMFAAGSIDVETLNRALAKAEADFEKTLPKPELAKLPTGAGKMENNIPPATGQRFNPSIAALEQGSAAAFSAINAARGGVAATGTAAESARKQLDVARRQQKLQEQIAANTARKPMVANIAG